MPEQEEKGSFEQKQQQLDDYIKTQFNTYFEEKKNELRTQPVTTPLDGDSANAAKKQIDELIVKPFIQPSMDETRLIAADAQDYVKFYTNNAVAIEYQEPVEKAFESLKKAGRPTTRADIFAYLQGQEYQKNPEEFLQKAGEKRKVQLEKANSAADFGAGSLEKARNDPVYGVEAFSKLTSDEMAQKLEGITF